MRRTLFLSMMVASSMAWANPPQTFMPGSLIIPVQANFQSECGAASTYGLVWKLLYENRLGGAFTGNPVTIYWAINGSKGSPNRCVPTNQHASPLDKAGLGLAAGKVGWDSGAWNDGCDFAVQGTSQPVVPVDYAQSFPTTPPYLYPNATIPENNTTTNAIPGYNTAAPSSGKGKRPASLTNTGTCTLGTGDAAPCGASLFTKIQYMGGLFIIDSSDAKRVIDAMQAMTAGPTPAPTYPYLAVHTSNTACPNLAGTFKVVMHQATTAFDAPVYKRITNVPSRLALVEFGGGVSAGILDNYLNNAGLSGTINGTPVAGTPATPGLVYDQIRALDDLLPATTHGYLNSKVAGKSVYKVMWAPHWELNKANTLTTSATVTTNTTRADALSSIAYFADQKGNGVMAECASIEGYEGGIPSGGIPSYSASTNFMFNGQIQFNGLSSPSGRNCTDPHYSSGACMRYGDPGNAFSQIGDFSYGPVSGHVQNFRVNGTGGTRLPGVVRLASSWLDYPAGTDDTGDNGWDFFTLRQKDNDPEKATIIYISGHDLSADPAGTRVILNTLLNLGADPVATDRNFTQAIGFIDRTTLPVAMGATATVVSSVYGVITGTLLPGATDYTVANGKNWMWPFTPGNLRGRAAEPLMAKNELNTSVMWEADAQMPLPDNRNLFTYFGGVAQASPTLSGGRRVKNDVAQIGWVPARIENTNVNASFTTIPNPNCTDVVQFGDHNSRLAGQHDPGLIAGADGICDIQQAIQWTSFTPDVSLTGKHTMKATDVAKYQAQVPEVQQFLQLVRGYCFALDTGGNPVMKPTDAQCLSYGAVGDNRAHLGGAVRSSAAIVTDSPKIPDSGAPRPTVAYVGTWDGQLHAIYVGGGSGYTGPTGGRLYLNPTCANASCPQTQGDPRNAAAATFKTDWSAKFATGGSLLPAKGTELWSFLPSSQLPWLKGNGAHVDSSPAVQDAFIDLYGDGIRRWHTILVVSIGAAGRELFALDVTNPLQPVLLWDVIGSNYQVGAFPDFIGAALYDYTITGNAHPLVWDNTKANYIVPPLTDPGGTFGNAYDFSDLGGSRALAIGQMREGLEPTYAVYVSSNASSVSGGANDVNGRNMSKALVVLALDLATGQRIWQWQQPYVVDITKPNYRLADNTVPPPVSMRNGTDGASSLLVGDMEGRLWELDAANGVNLTALRDLTCTDPSCNFPAFDTKGTSTSPQPITSNIAIAQMPAAATGPLAPFVNDTIVVMATAGTDWVPVGVAGQVHTLLLEANRRVPTLAGGPQVVGTTACTTGPCTDWTVGTARAAAATGGVLQEPTPLSLTGSYRVYGNIAIAGQYAYVPLVDGQGGNPMSVSKTLNGRTLELNLGALATDQASAELLNFDSANFGGVTVFSGANTVSGRAMVVADQVSKTSKTTPPLGPGGPDLRSPQKSLTTNQTLPYRLYNTVRRFLSQQ